MGIFQRIKPGYGTILGVCQRDKYSKGRNDLIELKNAGVTQIYDFRHKSVRGFKFIEKFACKELGINYIRYPFSYLNGEYPTVRSLKELLKMLS